MAPDVVAQLCGRTDLAAGACAEEEDDLAPRDLDDILGFKTPTSATLYDRFGRERERSGIAPGEDLAPQAWKPAVAPRRDY